jgi:hypothetical protein
MRIKYMRIPALPALIGTLLFALFVGYFQSGTAVVYNPAPQASSTGLAVLPTPTLPALALPSTSASTTTATKATSTKPVAPTKPVKKPVPVVAAASTPATTPAPTAPMPAGDITLAGAEVRAALVNILCLASASSGVQSISGSGVMIDPRGVILTNAHIGQYFLLRDRGVSCTIRTGSPATDAYYAAPIFISPAWISANSATVTEAQPTGTGEHDITLLAVTRSATSANLPASFSYVPLGEEPPLVGEPIVIGSYAAQFLSSSAIQTSLYPTIVYGSIKDIFTFDTNTIDVASLGGSIAAQEGSSGGGAVDASGELTATITTSTTQGDTSTRQLNAITASYIRRDYAAETGRALTTLLADSPSIMVANFAPQMPALEAQITAHL